MTDEGTTVRQAADRWRDDRGITPVAPDVAGSAMPVTVTGSQSMRWTTIANAVAETRGVPKAVIPSMAK